VSCCLLDRVCGGIHVIVHLNVCISLSSGVFVHVYIPVLLFITYIHVYILVSTQTITES
jgi:hypothetical protein